MAIYIVAFYAICLSLVLMVQDGYILGNLFRLQPVVNPPSGSYPNYFQLISCSKTFLSFSLIIFTQYLEDRLE